MSPTTSRRAGDAGSDQISHFFAELQERGHEPLLARVSGTIRCDVKHGRSVDRWYVTITRGDLDVSRHEQDADVVAQIEQSVLAAIIEGKANAMAAVLRGDFRVAGDLSLAMTFQRVFPGPPDAVGPTVQVSSPGGS
jgi:putative sterol carrier protein